LIGSRLHQQQGGFVPTIQQHQAKIIKNVTKREPRTAAQIAERMAIENPRQINRALGVMVAEGVLVRDTKRPPRYSKA
jgi:predicted ArsR family transcriptional regulator